MRRFPFLLACALSLIGAFIQAKAPIDTVTHLRTCHHLDLLYTSLYGRQHPFKKYIGWHRQLVEQYVEATKRCESVASKESAVAKHEVESTLQTVQDYAQTILGQYQLPTGSLKPGALPGAVMPTAPALNVAPGVTPQLVDQSLQQYIMAMNTMQQHHLPHMQPSLQAKILREQFTLFGFGVVFIGLITLAGRFLLLRNLNDQDRVSDDYDQMTEDMYRYTSRMRAIAHYAQKRGSRR